MRLLIKDSTVCSNSLFIVCCTLQPFLGLSELGCPEIGVHFEACEPNVIDQSTNSYLGFAMLGLLQVMPCVLLVCGVNIYLPGFIDKEIKLKITDLKAGHDNAFFVLNIILISKWSFSC